MKKLTVSIGNLGSATAGDYVDFTIWQGKRLLVSDRIAGKHSGTFHREYDVDYIRGEPLRIESNAPAGCSVGVNVAPSDGTAPDSKVQSENYVPGKSGFLIDYSTGKAEFNGKIVIQKQNGDVACVMGLLGAKSETLEQRVEKLTKRLIVLQVTMSQGVVALQEELSAISQEHL